MFEFRRVIWIFLNEKLRNGTKRFYVLNSNSRERLYELVYILNLNLFESFIWVTTWIYNVWLYARSTYGLKHSFSSVAILYCISSFKFKCCRNASQLRALCPVHWDLNITHYITENENFILLCIHIRILPQNIGWGVLIRFFIIFFLRVPQFILFVLLFYRIR